MPLQGLPNFLIYVRPRYIALHRERPELSPLQRLRQVLWPEKEFIHDNERSPVQ